MSRIARIKSTTGIYHVMIRGNNKQTIFHADGDYERFLSLLTEKVLEKSMVNYAWCLMPNHVHLLIKEKKQTISEIFRDILSPYGVWYNLKYNRVGHVFQGRFKSEPVQDQTYFMRVFRYIHRNPLDGKLCAKMEDYRWSSFSYYFRSGRYQPGDKILGIMPREDLEQYHYEKDGDDSVFLDIDNDEKKKLTEREIIAMVERSGIVEHISDVKSLPREARTNVLRLMLRAGVAYRKICGLTGVSMSVVRAVSKEMNEG